MFTLTVDRKRFAGAEAAFRHITQGQFIVRLMRLLGVKTWLWALEFQQRTGEGWPHWHLLIDLADCKGGKLDLGKAWKFWATRWGLGGLDLSVKDAKLMSAEHAVFYITKYLTKSPEGGFPVWVLESAQSIRFVQGCRLIGPLIGRPGRKKQAPKGRKNADRQPLIHRMSACRDTTKAYEVGVDDEGEISWKFRGRLPASVAEIEALANASDLPGRVEDVELFGKQVKVLTWGTVKEIRQALEDMHRFQGLRLWRRDCRMTDLMADNKFKARQLAAAGPPAPGAAQGGPALGVFDPSLPVYGG